MIIGVYQQAQNALMTFSVISRVGRHHDNFKVVETQEFCNIFFIVGRFWPVSYDHFFSWVQLINGRHWGYAQIKN